MSPWNTNQVPTTACNTGGGENSTEEQHQKARRENPTGFFVFSPYLAIYLATYLAMLWHAAA
jgi:hypothetical protein